MTPERIAAAIVVGLTALAAAFIIVAFLNWAEREVARHIQTALGEQADDWNEPTRTEVEADNYWNNFRPEVVDANILPLSQSPAAQHIRDAISENEVRRFRDELDSWGDVS